MHYRVILLTHSDETLSFADSYAPSTWENTELCIVNCGPNQTNAQAEALVVSTDGKAYDAVKASVPPSPRKRQQKLVKTE